MEQNEKDKLDRYFAKRGGFKSMLEREESWSEAQLTSKIAEYLKTHHPSIPFTCDMSGVSLTKQAARQSASNRAGNYKVPDLLIFVRKPNYGMLCLELKKLSAHPLKKDGSLKSNEHIKLQAQSIKWLRAHGQKADFAVGYKDTIDKINQYLVNGEFEYLLK